MAAVELVDVYKSYGPQEVLEEINLKIEDGEFVAIVGPSGCGKSTLLRLIAGLDSLTAGQIFMDNHCINDIPPAQRNMAMVFQNYALYPHMTVFENMAYGLKMRGLKKAVIKERVAQVAAILQLSSLLKRKPRSLSGGQRQRVAMGRAMVRSPAVFLFDEPLSNLDAKLRHEMRYEIKRLHQQFNTTYIYVTHDQTEALTMATKIVVLNQGKIEQIGSPQSLYQKPASLFVAGFTGHYPINVLQGRINLASKKIILNFGFELPLPSLTETVYCGKEIILTVRPEHLSLTANVMEGIPVQLEFIDDLGADKLLQCKTACGKGKFSVRSLAEETMFNGEEAAIRLALNKASLFDQKTGLRLGGWDE